MYDYTIKSAFTYSSRDTMILVAYRNDRGVTPGFGRIKCNSAAWRFDPINHNLLHHSSQ